MARHVDLTDKLGIGGKPTIAIGDTVLEVNNGAQNVMRLLDMALDGMEQTPSQMIEACELLFGKHGSKEIDKLGLSFEDYGTLLMTAMELVVGSAEGEAETLATTS